MHRLGLRPAAAAAAGPPARPLQPLRALRALRAARPALVVCAPAARALHYVSTPIFYVNARPHVGHLSSMVFADALHRWERFLGRPSVLSTGTDEHGAKVAAAAARADNTDPRAFVDGLAPVFAALAQTAHVDVFRFVRTTDEDHVATAQRFWRALADAGHLYRGKHAGWYCVSDETFYPETELERQPDGTFLTRESRSAVEWAEEDNWFFRLGAFRDALVALYERDPAFVTPPARHAQLLAELRDRPLADLSVSRPRERCAWGIPVPGDDAQVMYVWIDALLNYVTVADSADAASKAGELGPAAAAAGSAWPPAVHVVGKDIMRFHCVYWPAFLLAAGYETPRAVHIHNHWTMSGAKMSKSKGNVLDPDAAAAVVGVDALRYYLLHDAHPDHDSPFDPPTLVERYNVNLVNKLGNLVQRVCAPRFDVADAVAGEWAAAPLDLQAELDAALADVLPAAQAAMARREPGRALKRVNELALLANRYFEAAEPWDPACAPENRAQVVRSASEVCRLGALILQPFCPDAAASLLDRLAVAADRRTAAWAVPGADRAYGVGANERRAGAVLPKLDTKTLPAPWV